MLAGLNPELLACPDLEELSRSYPRGMAFLRDNVFVVHRIVQILGERLRDIGSDLRLALSPPYVSRGSGDSRPPPSPTVLTVKTTEGFVQGKLSLTVCEQMVMVSDERLVATANDGAVERIARTLLAAIQKALASPNERERSIRRAG